MCIFSFSRIVSLDLVKKRFPLTFVEKSPKKDKVQSCILQPAVAQASWLYRCQIVTIYLVFVIDNQYYESKYNQEIISIRKTFTPFLVAPSLKGLCAFYLSFCFFINFFFFFWKLQIERRREIGSSILSVCLKRKDWNVHTRFCNVKNFFFWFVGIVICCLYIQIFRKWQKYFKNRTSSLWVRLTLQYT